MIWNNFIPKGTYLKRYVPRFYVDRIYVDEIESILSILRRVAYVSHLFYLRGVRRR